MDARKIQDLPSEEVRSELERILASDLFRRSERLSRFLSFVVERSLQGEEDQLKEYVIGVEVYEKGADFDVRLDSTVRVEAARVRNKLREYYETLGARDPVQIGLPKGGYAPRFSRPGQPSAGPESAPQRAWWTYATLLSALLVCASAVAAFMLLRSDNYSPSTTVTPLTSLPGAESQPCFSPDGQYVAFTWNGPAEDNFDIYVKAVSGGSPHRLTFDPVREEGPAWSPDGRFVAFYRHAPAQAGFYLVPAGGGPERLIGAGYSDRFQGRFLDWFPDSKSLAVVDKSASGEPFSVFRLDLDSGQKHRLTFPPADDFGDQWPSVSPEGRRLAVARMHAFPMADIYVTDLLSGRQQRLTFDTQVINGLAWTSDGQSLVFSSERGGTAGAGSLWRVDATRPARNDSEPLRVPGVGPRASWPAVARREGLIAYAESRLDSNIWLAPNPSSSPSAGPKLLTGSSREDTWPRFSPDGTRLAFQSNQSGNWEIWAAGRDGTDPFQVTSFAGAPARYPSWSPDGRFLAFDYRPNGNSDIYTISLNGSSVRRVTSETARDETPVWSTAGGWIYFASNRSGDFEIWKAAVTPEGQPSGETFQLTHSGGLSPAEGPDGFLYFIRGPRHAPEVWKVPGVGGPETFVAPLPAHSNVAWTVGGKGVYYFAPQAPGQEAAIRLFSFAGRRDTLLLNLPGRVRHQHLALSPDGRFFSFSRWDGGGSDIMLSKSFR